MKGHYTKRSCKCEDMENCTCGSTWSFVIDVGRNPKTGRRKQGSGSGFKTKEEAQLATAALINEVNQGTFIKVSNILFKDWADEWLSYYIERNAPKPGTIRIRQHGINKFLQYFAHLKLKTITEEMYQEVLNDLKDQQQLARSTIESIHTAGKMIFKMAVNKRMLKVNPTIDTYIKKNQKVIIESDEEELPNFFEKEELDLFLDTVKNEGLYMDYLIFLLLSYTGMRIGELIAL